MTQTLLVTGASGQLGRLVVEQLAAAKAGRIIAATRDPSKLAELAAQGVELRKADFDDPASLAAALSGVDRLLIISTDAIDVPGRRLKQHQTAVTAAVKAGVKHIVYTSMPNPEPGSPIGFAPDHYGTEEAIKASGLSYTILRNSWYFENLKMSLPGALASGQWFTSAGEGRIANIARADCARAAAAALASTSTVSETLNITGAEAPTTEEIAAITARIFGKSISVVHVSDGQLAEGLKAHGLPPFMVGFIVAFDTNTRLGNVASISGDFERLTGRKPERLADYLEAHRADFAS